MTRSLNLALILAIAGSTGLASAEPPQVRTVALPDPGDKSKYHCWEPHIVANPGQPDRVVLSAIYRGQIGEGEKARGDSVLTVWRSEDSGRSWSDPTTPFVTNGRPALRLGADPVLAIGPGQFIWFAGCDYDWRVPGKPTYSSIKVVRSDDSGKKWGSPLALTELDDDKSGKGIVDKPWLAVDRSGGKRDGTVYAAWTRINEDDKRLELHCAALPSGGKGFTADVPLAEPIPLKNLLDAIHQVQLAVRSDGTLDAVWRRGDDANRLVHSFSQDGGRTFSKATPISSDEKLGSGQFPSLAATSDGRLLAAWGSQGESFAAVHSEGKWSAPRPPAGERPDGVRLTNPAAAASTDALWVLAYRHEKTPARVRVVLYRSTDHGGNWEEYAALATRDLTGGKRLPSPGDYIGVTAAKGRVYAAYVLPGEGKDGTGPWLYVSTVDVTTK